MVIIMRNSFKGKVIVLLTALVSLLALPVSCMNINPRIIALGGGTIAMSDVGLGGDNPASIAQAKSGLSVHHNNRFGFAGYEVMGGNLTLKTKIGTLGLGYDSEGISLLEERMGTDYESFWGEQKCALGYAGTIKEKVNLGVALLQNRQNVSSSFDDETLMQKNSTLLNLGLQLNKEQWGLGFALKNLQLGEKSDPDLGIGLRYGKAQNLVALLDILKTVDPLGENQIIVSGGLEAWVRDNLALRISLDQAGMVAVGLGASSGKLYVDYAYQIHPVGNTHYLTTGYLF